MKSNIAILALCVAAGLALGSCGGAKLSTAREQKERGEYYDAAKTYRKIYNKLTKKEERPLRGQVAYEMAQCHQELGQFARAAAAYQNAIRYEQGDTADPFQTLLVFRVVLRFERHQRLQKGLTVVVLHLVVVAGNNANSLCQIGFTAVGWPQNANIQAGINEV